ncbi:MAG: RagB/SusD family nutrient uptake outer membrane protein [Cyclobacteriaceae bacterium]
MKTKNNILINGGRIVLLALGVLSWNCSDDVLNNEPLDRISEGTFWSSEAEAQMALAGVYSHTSTGNERDFLSYIATFFEKSDNVFTLAGEIRESFIDGKNTAINGIIEQMWASCYTRIAKANYFIENIDKVNMDEAERNEMKAEARFIRSVYYFYLTTHWGDAPLVTKMLKLSEANSISRTPKAKIAEFAISELTEAAAHLPATRPGAEFGRVVKAAALAFKGRFQMAKEDWAGAAATYKSIIDLGVHAIDPQYEELFLEVGERSSEIIFSIQYIPAVGGKYSSQVPYRWAPYTAGGVSQIGFLNDLVESYECIDGLPIDESPMYDPQNPYEANGVRYRDPRLYYTVLLPNYSTFKGKKYVSHPDSTSSPDRMPQYSLTGYGVLKFVDENYSGDFRTYGGDTPIIRYAEVLLSYLESMLESGQPITQQLLDETINLVRGRAAVNMPPVTETDPASLRPILRNERRVELVLEGVRLWDLLRWNVAHINLDRRVYGAKVCPDPSDCGYQVDEEGYFFLYERNFREAVDYHWPIPQRELDINKSLTQNPGY